MQAAVANVTSAGLLLCTAGDMLPNSNSGVVPAAQSLDKPRMGADDLMDELRKAGLLSSESINSPLHSTEDLSKAAAHQQPAAAEASEDSSLGDSTFSPTQSLDLPMDGGSAEAKEHSEPLAGGLAAAGGSGGGGARGARGGHGRREGAPGGV